MKSDCCFEVHAGASSHADAFFIWQNGLSTASVIHCMPKHSLQASVCVFSDRTMAHQHWEFVAGQLFIEAFVAGQCVSFLTVRWRSSSRHSCDHIPIERYQVRDHAARSAEAEQGPSGRHPTVESNLETKGVKR